MIASAARTSRPRPAAGARGFHAVLVPVDLTSASHKLADRVAGLPLGRGAHVTLLHAIPVGLPREAEQDARADATLVLRRLATDLRRRLPKGTRVEHEIKASAPARAIAAAARAMHADLVVMGRGHGRLADVFLGSTAERVIRETPVPVLVVRAQPSGPYGRPLLALDTDEAAAGVIGVALRVLSSPRPRITLVHAYEIAFHSLVYPSLNEADAEDYRQRHQKAALRRVSHVVTEALERLGEPVDAGGGWRPHVRHGAARDVIPRAARSARADLVILGTQGRAGLPHAFLGTVAGDVLRRVPCDVLVVPPRRGTTRRAEAGSGA